MLCLLILLCSKIAFVLIHPTLFNSDILSASKLLSIFLQLSWKVMQKFEFENLTLDYF